MGTIPAGEAAIQRTLTNKNAVLNNGNSHPDEILNSWKQIAAYMKCGIRTAQRWEAEFGLPVHRVGGNQRGGVMALRSEINQWVKSHGMGNQPVAGNVPATHKPTPRVGFLLTEVQCGLTFARIAYSSLPNATERIERNLRNARKAYAEAVKFRARLLSADGPTGELDAQIGRLKTVLEKLDGKLYTEQ